MKFFLILVLGGLVGDKIGIEAPTEPVIEIKGITAKSDVFQLSSRKKPLVVTSSKSAEKFFERKQLAQLQKKIDFEKQVLMIFAWRGSGQDRLSFSVLESFPEQLQIKFTPGRTRDLRPHVILYAVRNNVIWQGKPIRQKDLLPHSIELRDSQSGFAGVSGKVWTIESDGTWRLQTFLNNKLDKPTKSGKLTAKQSEKLVSKLKQYNLAGLPRQMGKDPGVNPHTFSIRFGDKTTSMKLQGGQQLPPPDKITNKNEKNFVLIVGLLKNLATEQGK